jgi:predicted nucleic acid-binding Zn ribbon protein
MADPPVPAPRAEACPLCGSPVGANDARCPECNMTLDGLGARPPAFTRQSVWFWAVALLVIYLVVLAIVVAAR